MRNTRYPVGTRIQRPNLYVWIKTDQGLMPEHRWVAEQRILGRELKEGECVYRKRPDRLDNRPENLVVLERNLEKWKFLPKSRVIYIPSASVAREPQYA